MNLPGYDSWKTTEPLDWYDGPEPPEPDDSDPELTPNTEPEDWCVQCGAPSRIVGRMVHGYCVKCDHLMEQYVAD